MESLLKSVLLASLFALCFMFQEAARALPAITAQPADSTILLGQTSLFSATATGVAPISFQWYKDGAAVSNATNSSLTMANTQAAQAGGYQLIVTDFSGGSATSRVATLTVVGGQALLRLVEFTNSWIYNASGSNLGTSWVMPGYNDSIWATGNGIFAFSPFILPETVNTPLLLTNLHGAIITFYFRTHFTILAGHSNLVLVASNLLDDGAVFYVNGAEAGRVRLTGAVTAGTLAASAPQNGTKYELLFLAATNLVAGDNVLAVEVHQTSATSGDVVFGLQLGGYPKNSEPLILLSQPAGQVVDESQTVRFFADAFGGQPVFYQWFKDGAPLTGETNATLLVPAVHGADAGGFSFIASNLLNSATSAVATLSIVPDYTPPALLAAFATNDFSSVAVIFSEAVTPETATNIAHYSFSPSVTILNIQMIGPDRVLLTTSGRDVQQDYTLTVGGIRDRADAANIMGPASTRVGLDTRVVSSGLRQVQTVFIILMENQDWAAIKGNTNCPYINSLLPQASYCERYRAHNSLHPSEPNYLWLEAGDDFGYDDDAGPTIDRVHSTNHLSTLLNNAGIDWRGYMESMPAGVTGTNDFSTYLARHNPFAFFDDVTSNFSYCTNHVRPYSRFADDLTANRIGRYNFITPNVTNDMHNFTTGSTSLPHQGDLWLSHELPLILNSAAFSNNGAIFITWDESNGATTNFSGMIVLSPLAKGGGYASKIPHDHSSTLCTMQMIFGVRPLLGDAANANTLSELFQELTLTPAPSGGTFALNVNNLIPGKTNYVQASSDLLHWLTIRTNLPGDPFIVPDPDAGNYAQRFYRVIQAP